MSVEGGSVPQDRSVTRRWFLDRMAWLSSVTAAGAVLPGPVAAGWPARTGGDTSGALRALSEITVRAGIQQDPTEMSLAETVALMRSGAIRPEEMVEAYVDRIERFDGTLKAYADRPSREELLAHARRTPSDGPHALLRGACLAPKDNFYTADLRTEGGSLVYQGFQPDYDATAVASMRAAGGLMVGKAQMGNLAGGRAQVYGTTIPTTRNAWSPDGDRYSPGGSSSGTATAVAARLAVAGLGTQTGGSVIGPGNLQGLTCIKPTFGRVSLHGVIPLSYTRDHVGTMARDVLDAALLLQVIAHPDPADPRTLGLPPAPDFVRAATPFPGGRPAVRWPTRIGLWPGYLETDNPKVNQLRAAFVEHLQATGNVRVVGELRLPDQWEELTSPPLGGSHGDPTAFFIEALRKDVRDFGDRLPRFLNGMLQSADTYVKVQQARMLLLHRIQTQLFDQCDVALIEGTDAFDGTGLPALCMPIGMDVDDDTAADVPRGATLAALPFGEERLLAVAAAWQASTDHHRRRPPEPSA
jgi:aspartyl-tRNA(Asn)/glutamyl-tRNA(Gln) amidotransferase subunit A